MSSPGPPPERTGVDDMIGTQPGDSNDQSDLNPSPPDQPNGQMPATSAVDNPEAVNDQPESQHAGVSSNAPVESQAAETSDAASEVINGTPAAPPQEDVSGKQARVENVDESAQDVRESIEHDPSVPQTLSNQVQGDTAMPDAQETRAKFGSPLFVPEGTPAPSVSNTPVPARTAMPPPKAPAKRPLSLMAKIRQVQKQKAISKGAMYRPAAQTNTLLRGTPDVETFLDSILEPSRALSVHKAVEPVEDEDEIDRQTARQYQKYKSDYASLARKNGNGKLTFKQDVEWMRIQRDEDARRNKRMRDLLKARDEDIESDLFPDENERGTFGDNDDMFGFPGLDDDDDHHNRAGSHKRRKPDLPRKDIEHRSLADLEYRSMQVQIEADRDLQPKKRKINADPNDSQASSNVSSRKSKVPKTKSKGSKTSREKKEGKQGKATRKSAKQQREDQRNRKQLASLAAGNVWDDQADEDAPEQPTFTATNKQSALKELIASVPNQKEAKSDMAVLASATRDFDGRGSAKADGNGMWIVKGMKTSLKAYQLLGSAFMRRRENDPKEPRGGLMADQMGLGKTLMMLANIVNGRPPQGQAKTTLIVASPSLLTQWAEEIKQHTNGLVVMRYGAGNRLDSNRTYDILKSHDVVLTTYSEVMRSYPKNEPPIECQTAEEKIAWWQNTYKENRGVLHRMEFYRVVLDEAQAIKNYASRTSIACRALMARHRWALSGTPILNSLEELYPYFKFLGVPHTGSFRIFKNNYCGNGNPENAERLLVRLSQFMIRRTHADKMFGAPILKLPKAHQETFWCEFNPVERNIYDIVQRRFAKAINVLSKKGELHKSYGNALTMLLRLRQLTAHVLMLQFVMRDLLEVEDIERIHQVLRDHAHDDRHGDTILAVRKQLDQLAESEQKRSGKNTDQVQNRSSTEGDEFADVQEAEQGDEELNDVEPGTTDSPRIGGRGATGMGFGKSYDFKPYLASLTAGENFEKAREKVLCAVCNNPPREPWVTSCNHIYCRECLDDLQITAAQSGTEEQSTCLICGVTFFHAEPCEIYAEQELEDGPTTRAKGKKKRERVRPERENIKDDWLAIGGDGVLPSAKTVAVKAQILNWFQRLPGVKIIIYTQFLSMVKILAKAFSEEGWNTEQYHGNMSFKSREGALKRFGNDPGVNILLASLRCGGLGLNLTMASRVILIDPWWNSASEQQAFCRVFRIGQKEVTSMTRICVRNTVDARLIEMQDRKKEEIDKVMTDDGSTVKKLGIKDLLRLFGPITEDEKGNPFIMVDNPDPVGGFRPDKNDEGYANEV